MSSTRPDTRPLLGGVLARLRALLVVLVALVAVVGLGAPAASAHPASDVRNGVAAINPEPATAVEPGAAVSPALVGVSGPLFDDGAVVSLVTPSGEGTTRVGRWMGESEFETMTATGRVVEGGGGRTFVVEPPSPSAYPSAKPGSVYAEFDVPSSSLHPASKPEWSVIPGLNVTTTRYGPPPAEMPPATCIVLVCRR